MELSSSSSMCGQEGTWGPYPGTACQGRACLAGDGEGPVGAPPGEEAAWEPRSTGPREAPAWACTAGRKLPSCLRGGRGTGGGEERTTTTTHIPMHKSHASRTQDDMLTCGVTGIR